MYNNEWEIKECIKKKEVPVSAYNFFFFSMFYIHKHSIELCSNTSIV